MSTGPERKDQPGPFVPRAVCEVIHAEQLEADRRTYEEIRGLRKLVISLVVGGQLFTGGLNLAGMGYWLRQHEATPHAATVALVAEARAEEREDIRELRRELLDTRALLAQRQEAGQAPERIHEGGAR